MPLFLIRYHVGSFAGLRVQVAPTELEAIRQVQAWAGQQERQADDASYRVVVSVKNTGESASAP